MTELTLVEIIKSNIPPPGTLATLSFITVAILIILLVRK